MNQQGHVSINHRLVLTADYLDFRGFCLLSGTTIHLFGLIFLLKKSTFTNTLYASHLSFDIPSLIWSCSCSYIFAPMLIIFVSCVTFIVLSNSLTLWLVVVAAKRSKRQRMSTMGDFLSFLIPWQLKTSAVMSYFISPIWSSRSHTHTDSRLLDLPELPLHCILNRLSPEGLYSMAAVCTSLKDECVSDYYWNKHLITKWGKILGKSAYTEWQCYVAAHNRSISLSNQAKQNDWVISILNVLPRSFRKTNVNKNVLRCNEIQSQQSSMAFYVALESGKFWFPAQVYNRENGHAGFLLSCYDAKVRYVSATDTFHARYSPHGRQTLEENIEWGRIRSPAVDTSANTLHISDCLDSLQPGDHIEIQWRRNKEFPYGWWYGVVGHIETCNSDENHCSCHQNDTVVLEFKQYALGSRWRRKMVKRDSHREEGDAVDGFYGGIRKLFKNEEISTWKRLWPSKQLH